jgi:hypothetical protein
MECPHGGEGIVPVIDHKNRLPLEKHTPDE